MISKAICIDLSFMDEGDIALFYWKSWLSSTQGNLLFWIGKYSDFNLLHVNFIVMGVLLKDNSLLPYWYLNCELESCKRQM